jgi:hypothetical protein
MKPAVVPFAVKVGATNPPVSVVVTVVALSVMLEICVACDPAPFTRMFEVRPEAFVVHVAQAMTPAEEIVMGEVPESPALPTFAIGMPVGNAAAGMTKYPGAAVEFVLFPQNLYAPAVASVAVTAPVEALLFSRFPSPVKEETAEVAQPIAPVAVVKFSALPAALHDGKAAIEGNTPAR